MRRRNPRFENQVQDRCKRIGSARIGTWPLGIFWSASLALVGEQVGFNDRREGYIEIILATDRIIIGYWSHILPNRKICIMTTGQQIKSQIIDEAKSLAHLGDKKFSFSHILPSFHSPFGEPSSLLALDKCQNQWVTQDSGSPVKGLINPRKP